MARVKISYAEAQSNYDQMRDIMEHLEAGTSVQKGAKPMELKWEYDFCEEFPSRTIHVLLRGSKGRWWHISGIPVIPVPEAVRKEATKIWGLKTS